MDFQKIKNIIFDLGGVIIDIDPPRSFRALESLAGPGAIADFSEDATLFLDLEKGVINNAVFYDRLREVVKQDQLTNDAIAEAWNAMLLDIPVERIEMLEKLKKHFNLYILSNTNDIHVTAFNQIVKNVCGKEDLACFFDKAYFSHDLKMRKPEEEIYQFVIDDNQLNPEETLFIDDRAENIEAARQVGLQTWQVTGENGVVAFFDGV